MWGVVCVAEHEMRDGCNEKFKNINEDMSDVKKSIEILRDNQQKDREDLILYKVNTGILISTLEKIEVTMSGNQKTNEEIQKNLYNLNQGYVRLENGQKDMEDKLNKIEIKVIEKDSNGTENIANKIINNVYEDNQHKRAIKLMDRKELWGIVGGLIVAIGTIVIAIINKGW